VLIEKILKHYNEVEREREWSNPLRMSNAGKCARAIAYQHLKYYPQPLNARARMVFRLGDLVEQDIVDIAQQLGLTDMQKEIKVMIAGQEVIGHIDGLYEGIPFDVKSTSDYGFKKAKRGDIDYGYICQMHMYMKGTGSKSAVLIFYNKNTSHLYEALVNWDDAVWEEIEKRFKSVLESTKDQLPAREYGANAKGNLDWHCSYCAFCAECWKGQYELLFDDDGKPTLKLKEKK